MDIYGMGQCLAVIPITVQKVTVSWTLIETVFESCACEDHAFLIASQTTAIAIMGLIHITTTTSGHWFVAQHVNTESTSRLTVEPFQDAHAGYVVTRVR